MKHLTKVINLFLALLMVLTTLPFTPAAANNSVPTYQAQKTGVTSQDGNWEYDIVLGKNEEPRVWITRYLPVNKTTFTVPSVIDDMRVQSIELSVPLLNKNISEIVFEENIDLISSLGNFGDTRHCGTVKPDGTWDVYNGNIRFKDKDGSDMFEYRNEEYTDYVAEHVKPYSWLKFPYIKEMGYPEGIYRVAPLSRINVCDQMPKEAPLAQEALKDFRDAFGYAQAPLLFNYARLIELLASAECAANALEEDLSGQKFPDELERTEGKGVGIVEAPRGTLIHHYESDDNGLCNYANIVVATIQNNPAMEMGIHQVAKDYIKPGVEVDDSIFNLMEMVIRAYDPCLSCATHSMDSQMRLAEVDIVDSEGNLIKKF